MSVFLEKRDLAAATKCNKSMFVDVVKGSGFILQVLNLSVSEELKFYSLQRGCFYTRESSQVQKESTIVKEQRIAVQSQI